MNTDLDEKRSSIPASAATFAIFLILSWVLRLTVLPYGAFAKLQLGVTLLWSAKLLFDLIRWLKRDKAMRPRMRFPVKTALALGLVFLLCVFGGYLVVRDMYEYL